MDLWRPLRSGSDLWEGREVHCCLPQHLFWIFYILHIVALTSFTLIPITLISTFNFKYLGRQQKLKQNAIWPFLRFDPSSVKPQSSISATPCKHSLLPCYLNNSMPPVPSMLLQTGNLLKPFSFQQSATLEFEQLNAKTLLLTHQLISSSPELHLCQRCGNCNVC